VGFAQLEMILQAQEYETAQGMQLDEFFESTKNKWRTDLGRYAFTASQPSPAARSSSLRHLGMLINGYSVSTSCSRVAVSDPNKDGLQDSLQLELLLPLAGDGLPRSSADDLHKLKARIAK